MKKETREKHQLRAEDAKKLLKVMIELGYSCSDIEKDLGGAVSYRTLYRWLNGDSKPKRARDVEDLKSLCRKYVAKAKANK